MASFRRCSNSGYVDVRVATTFIASSDAHLLEMDVQARPLLVAQVHRPARDAEAELAHLDLLRAGGQARERAWASRLSDRMLATVPSSTRTCAPATKLPLGSSTVPYRRAVPVAPFGRLVVSVRRDAPGRTERQVAHEHARPVEILMRSTAPARWRATRRSSGSFVGSPYSRY